MKKTLTLIALCGAMVTLSQCSEKTAPKATATKTKEVTVEKAKYTPEQLAQGKAIYTNNCGKCHELHAPSEFTMQSWDDILPGMSNKANLSSADAGLVRAYVMAGAKG